MGCCLEGYRLGRGDSSTATCSAPVEPVGVLATDPVADAVTTHEPRDAAGEQLAPCPPPPGPPPPRPTIIFCDPNSWAAQQPPFPPPPLPLEVAADPPQRPRGPVRDGGHVFRPPPPAVPEPPELIWPTPGPQPPFRFPARPRRATPGLPPPAWTPDAYQGGWFEYVRSLDDEQSSRPCRTTPPTWPGRRSSAVGSKKSDHLQTFEDEVQAEGSARPERRRSHGGRRAKSSGRGIRERLAPYRVHARLLQRIYNKTKGARNRHSVPSVGNRHGKPSGEQH